MMSPATNIGSDRAAVHRQALRAAIDLARYAPSLHNAQPWLWRIAGKTAELSADPTRAVPIVDPSGREMLLGCGAALQYARISLAAVGWQMLTTRFPDPATPGLLARIELVARDVPVPHTARLAAAIPERRTDRRPYSCEPIPDWMVERIQLAAGHEHARLQIVTDQDRRLELAVLASRADHLQASDPRYQAELAQWTGYRPDGSGVPPEVVPRLERPRHSNIPLRDFATVHTGELEVSTTPDEQPAWCVLLTDNDTALDHLQAGEALARLMLTATDLGLASSIQSQPVEVPAVRTMMQSRLFGGIGHIQALLRLGWPEHAATSLVAAPRRPLRDILVGDTVE